jgi:hypothetical protein
MLRPEFSGYCKSGRAVFIDIFDGSPHDVPLKDLEFIGPEFTPETSKMNRKQLSILLPIAVLMITILASVGLLLSVAWALFGDLF